ncbi:MAG: DUF3881 family protein [Lachnospiraceae bacterium]|nr:DUF3881 family protein [Lachnospiraceae bacterium]MBR6469607.1 DUF3881 family protein [Lachnospiraceae bacterium]MBR6485712.1 DUF3881 family protein [Lachnospiraceae bacterium]
MHQYLSAAGFSNIKTKKDLMELVRQVILEPSEKSFIETDRNSIICEYVRYFSPTTGIAVRGEYDDSNELTLDFYYPVCRAYNVSTNEYVSVERYSAHEYFAGVCDDPRIGVTLIFDICNSVDVMKRMAQEKKETEEKMTVSFSGLSVSGMIMLPIKKDKKEKLKTEKNASNRNKLLMAARNGDENAIESLTLDDIDTYAQLSKKIRNEDVYTLVESYFMPYGVECNLYSIMGEITDFTTEKNLSTDEELYILTLDYNGMAMNISINKKDLLGEPLAGRRFKGTVLMQGKVDFS